MSAAPGAVLDEPPDVPLLAVRGSAASSGRMAAAPPPSTRGAFRFPGGATAREVARSRDQVELTLHGELDRADQYVLVDIVTGYVVSGVRRVHVDARDLSFADVAVSRSILRIQRSLARHGGALTLEVRSATVGLVWAMVGLDFDQSVEIAGTGRPTPTSKRATVLDRRWRPPPNCNRSGDSAAREKEQQ